MVKSWQKILAFILGSAVLAALTAWLSPGAFWRGFGASFLLIGGSALALFGLWRGMGGGKHLALWMTLAFVLRLGLGLFFSLAYPLWGYDEPEYNAGYVFRDAYHRDREAYAVALSGERLLFNPNLELGSDQYGGLGVLSALVYRTLSADAHRPALVLILGAFFFALGVPFLYRAAQVRLTERAAQIAVWIYLLYPDGLFFTASQMREPFMLGLLCVGLWAVILWRERPRAALTAGALAVAGMLFISTRSAVFVVGILVLLAWLEFTARHPGRGWKALGWLGILLAGGAAFALTWGWFREASVYDRVLTLRASGRLAAFIADVGERYILPTIVGYGLAQPVFPAALVEPAIPLAKVIILLRSAGWYALAPLLVYALWAGWRATSEDDQRLILWAAGAFWAWALISALRGGGDMTDNPRYRMLLLPLAGLAVGWALEFARRTADRWLGRILAVEGIFLAVFLQWYLSRYLHWGGRLSLPAMGALIAGLSALVLAGGWIYDRLHPPRPGSR